MNALIMVSILVLGQVHQPPSEDEETSALVQRIQENLARIDETLLSTIETVDPASTLESVRQTHMDVIRDLEELINLAKYRPSNRNGGGGGGGQSQPPPRQQPESESNPRESDGSNAPKPGEEEPPGSPQGREGQQEQPRPQGSEPQDGDQLDDSDPARNNMGGPPPEEELGDPIREDSDARWGLLPPKLQERLMNLHVDDIPSRYRDWLTAYIRALQRLEEAENG